MRRLVAMGLTSPSGGNISVRVNHVMWITAGSIDKGELTPDSIFPVEIKPDNPELRHGVSMETGLHHEIYKHNKGIRAIVHAHPPLTTAFIVSGKPLPTDITGEAWAVLGKPARVSYARMGSYDLAFKTAEAAQSANVLLLEHHGVVTTGKTLFEAFDRLVLTEHVARTVLAANSLGGFNTLSQKQKDEIDDFLRSRSGT